MGEHPHYDPELARLCGLRADRFLGSRSIAPSHVSILARIALRLVRLPLVQLKPGHGREGDIIRQWLDRRSFGRRTIFHQAASILRVERRADALAGSIFATLRRMERKAAHAGVQCRAVERPEERSRLLERAIAFEKTHPNPRYRRTDPKTSDLDSISLWLAAYSRTGEPLVLCVVPVSGNVALLRYFRVLTTGPQATLARYALTAELLRTLSARRIRYLVDNVSPIAVQTPVRHFATMVGFRIVRARLAASTA